MTTPEPDTPAPAGPPHWSADEFRRHGHAVIEWLASYWDRLETFPVASPLTPGEVRAALPAHAPETPEPFEAVLGDLDRVVVPGLMHWQSPSFFGFFPADISPPAVLGELVSAGLGVQGMLWATSPACTELEAHLLDWMLDALGLPGRFRSSGAGGGVIQDSASSSTLCAVVAARERAQRAGASIERLVVYTSSHAHSSVEKGARVAGIPGERVRLVDVDERYRLRPDALAAQLAADRASGLVPVLVAATVGTTGVGAVDPVAAVAGVLGADAAAHPEAPAVWLHVDAAWAGVATVCPEHRDLVDGLDRVDSYTTNPHKWLLTNFDCSLFWVADRRALVDALSIVPEYLRNAASESGAVVDYRDWQVPLGRRFRALKLWFVLRAYGLDGLRAHIRHHVALAAELDDLVRADERFELVAPRSLALVCLRHRDGDEATQRVLDAVNGSGTAYLTHNRVDGRLVIRVAVGATRTERRHVLALWESLRAAAGGPAPA